jgi:putative redox protein
MSKSTIEVRFSGSHGLTLAARLDLPSRKPTAYALFAHCFTCSKDSKAASYISSSLAAAGIAVLRFDFTGLGGSDGDFANTGFSSNIDDLVAAADFLREEYEAPRLLVGHSLGGAAVLAAAPRIAEILAVATVNAPADPSHVIRNFASATAEIESSGEAEVVLGGRRFMIRKSFIDDVRSQKLEEIIPNLHRALLVMHAPHDAVVDVSNAQLIFTAAKHPKSFISLDDADHMLSRRDDARYAGMVLAAWAARYMPVPASAARAQAGSGDVVVAEAGDGKYAQTVNVGRHWLRADEPPSIGGDDSGPSPYQLLSAALGACTSMTMRMYANQKKLPLDKVTVTVKHKKIHAEDCIECETREGKIDKIEREIHIEGDLTDEQRNNLMKIADRCPVHRTLHSEVVITSRLV